MYEVEQNEIEAAVGENLIVKMRMRTGPDHRRYNLPSHEEVAVIFVGEEEGLPEPQLRDIVVYPRDRPVKTISTLSANLYSMMYPLFFLRGDPGWHNWINQVSERRIGLGNVTTMCQF